MPSPSLLAWQPPPKPDQRVLVAVGPAISAPVDLLKIANDEFTNWKYWVAPMAPLVSGGALFTVKPYCALPRPSKLRLVVGVAAAMVCCRTRSCVTGAPAMPGGRGMRRTGSASCLAGAARLALGAFLIISLSGAETSCLTFQRRIEWGWFCACAAGRTPRSVESATTVPIERRV